MKIMALTVALAAAPAWADAHSPGTSPTPSYQSAFADYKASQDEEVRDWRRVNDEMGRLRGHMGHLESSAMPHDHGKPADTPKARGDRQ